MNSVVNKATNQSATGKCPPVIPSPSFSVTRTIPTTMKSMITMIVVMIEVAILFAVESSDHMPPVVCIMSVPSGVIGMMMLMIEMMLMIHPVLVTV